MIYLGYHAKEDVIGFQYMQILRCKTYPPPLPKKGSEWRWVSVKATKMLASFYLLFCNFTFF